MIARAWILGGMIAGLLTLAVPASAQDWPVSETRLDNGLHVIVREDHRAPVAVSQIWYAVGSSYESRPHTGISHVLEHMMFKGTKDLKPGEFSEIVARNGGEENAFTGRDYTAYYEQLAADRLETAFRLEADRMHQLRLDPEAFRKERDVVLEERRLRIVDQPVAAFGERFNAVSYPVSAYRQPVIGWSEDLHGLDIDDLRDWYRRWYSPANATLVVVGDVEPEAVFALARKYFGPVPGGEDPQPPVDRHMSAPGERRLTASDDRVRVPHLSMAYEVPSAATAKDMADVYALEVLAGVLDGGDGARLAQRLVRDQSVAAGIGAGYSPVARLDTRFSIQATPTPDTSPEALEGAVREQIAALRREPVDAETLERAQNQILADHLYGLDSMFYQAMRIGRLEVTGIGWEWLKGFEAGIRDVTAADVQRVARTYLTDDRLAVGVLRPGGGDSDTDEEAE
ncbi:insulinase family protein [Arhodomonas aquaeolei]|uniref:M16 family metallopeptidase n=1 Tax=Arhodomonas aquaeolei TaxID=2369 RepID=UPI0021698A0B|nr:pitrilysin family protein [Arhodomonas aquaeolei]MCS4503007.1 insulinase family protein [Arhodomonas aquaeolei]